MVRQEVLTRNRKFTRDFPNGYNTRFAIAMILVEDGIGTGCFIRKTLLNGHQLNAFLTNEHVLHKNTLAPGRKFELRQERQGDFPNVVSFELELGHAVSRSRYLSCLQ